MAGETEVPILNLSIMGALCGWEQVFTVQRALYKALLGGARRRLWTVRGGRGKSCLLMRENPANLMSPPLTLTDLVPPLENGSGQSHPMRRSSACRLNTLAIRSATSLDGLAKACTSIRVGRC